VSAVASITTSAVTELRRPLLARTHGGGGGGGAIAALFSPALAAVRAAAIACQPQVGRGDPIAADAAATGAMRSVLGGVSGEGVVVIGEGEKDGAPMLYNGERLGGGGSPRFDIAVDPLEGTKACATGLPGALSTIALASPSSLWQPGSSFYMEKLVVGSPARDAIDITRSPAENAANVADALGKPIRELRIVVLDKPRHGELIDGLRGLGAHVRTPRDGDIAGALQVLLAAGDADILIGIGGTPEGVITACAVRALGGAMQARLAPQREDEARRLAAEGAELERVHGAEDLASGQAVFAACGISGGELLRAPSLSGEEIQTESLLLTRGAVCRVIEATPASREDQGRLQRPWQSEGSFVPSGLVR
jgi:fructose-1,6-bisphosphatase II